MEGATAELEYIGTSPQTEIPLTSKMVAGALDRVGLAFFPKRKIVQGQHEATSEEKLEDLAQGVSDLFDWATNPRSEVPVAGYTEQRKVLEPFFSAFKKPFLDFSAHTDALANKEDDAKLIAAQFNQQLAHDFYKASTLPMNHPARENAALLVGVMQELAKVNQDMGVAFMQLARGAMAQAAVMNALDKGPNNSNYFVIAPDYNNPKEILKWDVKGGVDMVAISKTGDIHLIDVKGRYFEKDRRTGKEVKNDQVKTEMLRLYEDTHPSIVEDIITYINTHKEKGDYDPRFKDHLNNVDPDKVRQLQNVSKVKMTIPSSFLHISRIGEVEPHIKTHIQDGMKYASDMIHRPPLDRKKFQEEVRRVLFREGS